MLASRAPRTFFEEWHLHNCSWIALLSAGKRSEAGQLSCLGHLLDALDPSLLRAACKCDIELTREQVEDKNIRFNSRTFSCPFGSETGQHCTYSTDRLCALARHCMFAHGHKHPIFSAITCNQCPLCQSTFASKMCARLHLASAFDSGKCDVDRARLRWPLVPPRSLNCTLCDFSLCAHQPCL